MPQLRLSSNYDVMRVLRLFSNNDSTAEAV